MELHLENICAKLEKIQIELRKLGSDRRDKYRENTLSKLVLAEQYYDEFTQLIKLASEQENNPNFLSVRIKESLTDKILLLYEKIKSYTQNKEVSTSLPETRSESEVYSTTKMETFDFKTAATLVPVMDDKDETIEKIIDGIEMYDSFLKSKDCKNHLITFVLKTRLTRNAKLKLKSSYVTCSDLIHDIKQYLLPKKSAISLITQLNNISQEGLSISQFGEKVEDLFVNLTISQANSNEKANEILRPINEQLAIKKFADGLRNRRLSTIIAARNYANLKDAVRAAEDEELAQPQTSHAVLNMQGKSRNYYRGRPVRGYRGFLQQGTRAYGNQNWPSRPHRGTYYNQGFYNNRGQTNVRGRSGGRSSRGNYNQNQRGRQNVYSAQPIKSDDTQQDKPEPDNREFFRE